MAWVCSRIVPRVLVRGLRFSSLHKKTNTPNSNSTRILEPHENQPRLMLLPLNLNDNEECLPLMSLEHLRFLGRFQASILNDIYLYSVLFYWRMHWDTNLSVSSAHVELCRHSCKIKPEFHLAFIKSLTKRKMTLYRDLIFCCSSLARLHFCRSLVSGPRFFGRSAGCLPVERKVIEHSHCIVIVTARCYWL